MKSRISGILRSTYECLPRSMKSLISRSVYRPKLGKGVHLYGWNTFSADVEIGDYSYIKTNHFMRNVEIGKFCCIAEGLSVGLNQHPYQEFSSYQMFGRQSPMSTFTEPETLMPPGGGGGIKRTYIGNDVWIGENVTIKDGVKIGNGAVIGAAAVVTKDVPPYAIVAGVPAKIIKYRFDDRKIKLLQDIKWWDWSPETIYKNLELLMIFDESLRVITMEDI